MFFRIAIVGAAIWISAMPSYACEIKSADGAAQIIRYQIASGVCPYFKKQMGFGEVSALFQLSGSITGIMDDYKAGEPYKECESLIRPFIEGIAKEWLKSDRAELCSSVKEEIDTKPPLASIFRKWELLD